MRHELRPPGTRFLAALGMTLTTGFRATIGGRRSRRRLGLLAALIGLISPARTSAQSRELLTIVAPAAPGGGWDQLARVMQAVLQQEGIAPRVAVENVPGAAGTIGLARFVASEGGNARALLVTGLVMIGGIAQNESPVTLRDVTPIARLVGEQEVVVVPASSPLRTMSDLIDALRRDPRAVAWGGGSAGGTDQMLVDLIARAVGVDPSQTSYVAFSGGGEAAAAVLGSQVTAAVSGWGELAGHIAEGRLRALAIAARERVVGVEVPTLREQGVAVDLANWRGVVAPPGLTPARRAELTALVERMARSASWRRELQRRGWEDQLLTGDGFTRLVETEQHRADDLARLRRGAGGATPASLGAGFGYAALGAFAACLVWSLPGRRRRTTAGPEARRTRAAVLVLAALALDILLIGVAGFVVASTACFVLTAAAFGERRWLRALLVAGAFSTATYVLFHHGLGVTLPAGTAWDAAIR